MATKPSLALIPSAYKASKVYSVLPSDGSGDLNFTRTSEATRVNKDGLIEKVGSNVPRIDYPMIDGVVSGCPSLLLEPQRTNLITYSEDFSQWWSLNNVTQFSNQTISPNGTLNADKITIDNSNSLHYIITAGSFINTGVTTDKVFSVFVKKNEITRIGIVDLRYLNGLEVEFNLETKSIGRKFGNLFVDASIEEFNNDWLRCNVVYDTEPLTSMSIVLLDDNYNSSTKIRDYTYQGDGSSSFYVWGAQLEQGSYPTSYIPTNGSTVTRSAETCNGAGDAATFNDSEGVLMAEISALNESGGFRDIRINDGTSNNRVAIRYSFTTNEIEAYVVSNGTETFKGEYVSQSIVSFNKIAVKYKENDFSFFVNGFELATDTSGATPIGLDNINFSTSSFNFYGKTKQIQYFDTALTDEELEYMTSYRSFNEMARDLLYTIE